MKDMVYVLFEKIYDPYGCLEDNIPTILGIFTTEEKANKIEKELREKDKRKRFDYWIDLYKLDELEYF